MDVILLIQKYPNYNKCESILSEDTLKHYARMPEKYQPKSIKCKNNAKYLIDGAYFCRKHAAFYTLDNIINENKTIKENYIETNKHRRSQKNNIR